MVTQVVMVLVTPDAYCIFYYVNRSMLRVIQPIYMLPVFYYNVYNNVYYNALPDDCVTHVT